MRALGRPQHRPRPLRGRPSRYSPGGLTGENAVEPHHVAVPQGRQIDQVFRSRK